MWKVLLSAVLAMLAQGILIPLTGTLPRCMIVYSVGESETVKLDLNLPDLPGQLSYQYYQISLKNTQNQQTTAETVRNGKYRKQLALSPSVIYDLCIRAQSTRDYGIVHVEYSSVNTFAVSQAEVKVPQGLLKEQDLTQSYLSAQGIIKNLDAFVKIQGEKAAAHAQIFRKTEKISERLVQISVAEVVVIVLGGCYQFYALWKYLKTKNYL